MVLQRLRARYLDDFDYDYDYVHPGRTHPGIYNPHTQEFGEPFSHAMPSHVSPRAVAL